MNSVKDLVNQKIHNIKLCDFTTYDLFMELINDYELRQKVSDYLFSKGLFYDTTHIDQHHQSDSFLCYNDLNAFIKKLECFIESDHITDYKIGIIDKFNFVYTNNEFMEKIWIYKNDLFPLGIHVLNKSNQKKKIRQTYTSYFRETTMTTNRTRYRSINRDLFKWILHNTIPSQRMIDAYGYDKVIAFILSNTTHTIFNKESLLDLSIKNVHKLIQSYVTDSEKIVYVKSIPKDILDMRDFKIGLTKEIQRLIYKESDDGDKLKKYNEKNELIFIESYIDLPVNNKNYIRWMIYELDDKTDSVDVKELFLRFNKSEYLQRVKSIVDTHGRPNKIAYYREGSHFEVRYYYNTYYILIYTTKEDVNINNYIHYDRTKFYKQMNHKS